MVNVFSYCLYGPENPRYYAPLLKNIDLVQVYFPSWKVYVYIAPDVPQSMIEALSASSNVILRPTGRLGAHNMIERFFAIDEPGVDIMMVRDADSFLHHRDRWAIHKFVSSSYQAHTIRDHKEHTARIMGGLWGLRKSAGLRIRDLYASYTENTTLGHRVAHDQNFLMDVVYPLVVKSLLVHYSKGPVFKGETAVPFPFEWSPDFFCGKTESVYQEPLAKLDLSCPLSFLSLLRM